MDRQQYVIDASVQPGYVGNRDARTFLPFLLPHLRPGMDILDAGCGVGAITLDLAQTVDPRRIVGIDVDADQVAAARRAAADVGVQTATFAAASVCDLPFPDHSFDVVYANAVLLYLREPERALTEFRRVLRRGGVAAVSDDDLSTTVFSPEVPGLHMAPTLFTKAVEHEGGNTSYSRHLRAMLRGAGFARTQGHALTPETYGDEESTRWIADFAIGLFSAPSMADTIVSEGWATPAELDALLATIRDWGDRPDAFMTWLYCGALGWVD